MKVYLCGPINGRSDADCKDWRERAKALLNCDTLDPMARDFRGKEASNVTAIVEGDLADIKQCDALLVRYDRPSVGTSMEILIAYMNSMPVHIFTGERGPLSPWLVYHATEIHETIEEACEALNAWCS